MFMNYVKIALRNLIKQKVYSLINILGLTVGIASCLLIVMFVMHEMSYDDFHANADRIYKVALERKYPNHITNYAIIPESYADVMSRDFPEVAQVINLGGPFNDTQVTYRDERDEEKRFDEDFVMCADSNFFKFFSIKLIKGEPDKALNTINDIVLTETTARRYFGNIDPIGKTLHFFNQDFNVNAICEDVPENSHMKFDILFKWNDNFIGNGRVNFITFAAHTYLELKAGTDPKALEAKFPQMVDTYAAAQIEQDLGKSWQDYKRAGNGYRYFLQPLTFIHLDPTNIEAKMTPGGNINYIYFLISVALLILIIACINFMNLATARSAERSREVGLRKAMGSLKGQLVSQFLIESIVLSLFATALALGLAHLALPFFNNLADKSLSLHFSPQLALGLGGVALLVGVLAGSYPAFALSSFNPVLVMKSNFSGSKKGTWLRNGLVVFQFFISIILIVGTLVVSDQMKYMQSKSLGFDRENIVVVEQAGALDDKALTFIEELKRLPGIESASTSFALLGRQTDFFGAQFSTEGSTEILTTKSTVIDDDFAETVGLQFAEGKGFSKDTQDSLYIILNETAVRAMDIKDPVGKKLSQVQRTPAGNVTVQYTIVGIVKDFNFQSLRDPITPLVLYSMDGTGGNVRVGYAYARIKGKNLAESLNLIESKWQSLATTQPFKYVFLDQDLNRQYDAEQRAGHIFAVFSGLAIVIACVGLFGLAAYTTNLRTKEIGVRKVLGASVGSIVFLLSKDLIRLIVVAFVLAVPLAWYMMDNWLSGFAYHVSLGIGVFLIAGVTSLLISWLTVSYQSIKAAIVNPVKSLRSQ
jgi:putative ABC transport system permease protein